MTNENPGDVECPLIGDPVMLRCTLRAAKEINAAFGSFSAAYAKLAGYDFDLYVAIVAAGTNKTRKEVEEPVFNTGLPVLVKSLSEYLGRLSNGGRPPN